MENLKRVFARFSKIDPIVRNVGKERLGFLVDSMPNPIIIADLEGRILAAFNANGSVLYKMRRPEKIENMKGSYIYKI